MLVLFTFRNNCEGVQVVQGLLCLLLLLCGCGHFGSVKLSLQEAVCKKCSNKVRKAGCRDGTLNSKHGGRV